jgi:hypothetical protein
MDDPTHTGSLSEEKAALVLDRAAKLDSTQGTRVTVDALREIALEAGISPEAFERALTEVQAGGGAGGQALQRLHVASDEPTGLRALLRRGGIFAVGAGLAFIAQVLPFGFGIQPWSTTFLSLVVAMFVAIALAASRHDGRQILDFELDLGMLWTGLTLVFMLANGGEVLEVMMPLGVGAALVGGLIVALGPSEPKPKELPERT